MKRGHPCSACGGIEVLHVKDVADATDDFIARNQLPHQGLEPRRSAVARRVARVRTPGTQRRFWSFDSISTAGPMEAFLCAGCGQAEFYIRRPEIIPVDGKVVRESSEEAAVKNASKCPKCFKTDVLHLTQVADATENLTTSLEFGTQPEPMSDPYVVAWRVARIEDPDKPGKVMTAGVMEAFVCVGCGFTQFYVRDPATIPVDGKSVVRKIAPKDGGPYR